MVLSYLQQLWRSKDALSQNTPGSVMMDHALRRGDQSGGPALPDWHKASVNARSNAAQGPAGAVLQRAVDLVNPYSAPVWILERRRLDHAAQPSALPVGGALPPFQEPHLRGVWRQNIGSCP